MNWGKVVKGRYRDYNECPDIELPAGVDTKYCNGATCILVCPPGYHPMNGAKRSHCKHGKKKGTYWTEKLTSCQTCPDINLMDKDISEFCYIEASTNQRICTLSRDFHEYIS